MPSYVTPKKNTAFVFSLGLPSIANSGLFQDAPTLTTGDVKVSKDGGALANLTTLPTAAGKLVNVSLSASEMNADNVNIVFSDTSGGEWADVIVSIQTTANQIDDLSTFDHNADTVDANITHVNEIEVTGNGEDETPWNPV